MPENLTFDTATTAEFESVTLRPTPGEAVGSSTAPRLKQRRSEPRYPAVEDKIWMQWWDGDDYLGRAGRLINVSRHGAMIVSTVLFRPGQTVALFLEEPSPQTGVVGTVLGVTEGFAGRHQARLKFRTACPDDFFEAAANGFEAWLVGNRTRA